MEVINEASKLVAKALELLKVIRCLGDDDIEVLEDAIKLLEDALEKLSHNM
jgi:hypothetical protein